MIQVFSNQLADKHVLLSTMIKKVYIEYLLLKNDKESFHQVLTIIQPKLLIFATSIIKDSSLAQDAVQEAMISIIKGFNKLKNHRKFHAWIYQVTRNKCIDMIRKNHKYKNDSDINTIEEPSSITEDLDGKIDMMGMIKQLPHKQQTVIHLFYYDGFSIIEIAGILHKPAGTIKSLLFDAREKLKYLLGE